MNKLSFKIKIIIIFLIPVIALMYFSSTLIQSKYDTLDESSIYKLTAEITQSQSKLLHNLQIERGLSSGYIDDIDAMINRDKLLNQYKLTDATYQQFLFYVNLISDTKSLIDQEIKKKNEPYIQNTIKRLKNISELRMKVLNHTISFDEEVEFYNQTNTNLLESIRLLVSILKRQSNDNQALYILQQLKESAGQERAYLYNQLVSNDFNIKQVHIIKRVQEEQLNSKNQFLLLTTRNNLEIYKSINNYKEEKLVSQFRKEFLFYVNLKSNIKSLIEQEIKEKNIPYIQDTIKRLNNISEIRMRVLNHNIKFDEEVEFYNETNANLIQSIRLLVSILKRQSNDNQAIYILQQLKESAGQERAYLYNQLVSSSFNTKQVDIIKKVQKEQVNSKNQFLLLASTNDLEIYKSIYSNEKEEFVTNFRKEFLNKKANSSKSSTWFKISTERINTLEDISSNILNLYIKKANQEYREANKALFITAFLWTLLIFSLIGLTVILKNIIKKEEKLIESLRISAYTFDSHEAMTITDVDGTIIKVNKAFTKITGYTQEEVIGRNPRLLKSMQHSEQFYKDMWNELKSHGKWTREIYNKRKNDEIYPERLSITAIKNNNNEITHYIAQFLDLTDLKKAQKEIQFQANHDFLTDLVNRKYLHQRLHEEYNKAIRHKFLHAFLFIDIDGFKSVNDNFGHEVGDKLLIDISKKLLLISRKEDIVARIGGDEFAIVILNIDKDRLEAFKDIKQICTKIISTLNEPFEIDTHQINIGASIGIKMFPNETDDENNIMLHADKAMYEAKENGKNQFVFFNKKTEEKLKYFQLLEKELKDAYTYNQFIFFYQPKVDISSKKIVGAEALIRWQHPTKGLIFPDKFISIASDIGLIPKITILALHDILKFLQLHQDIFKGSISINIGSNELLTTDFENKIISIIQSYGVDPSQIELEITEGELIKDLDAIALKINILRDFGIKFSIDDFGTGYSSISYLQKLPVDILKIDREFLNNFHGRSGKELIKLVLDMARTFYLDSIVEGVETQEHLEFLEECGAIQYQGNLFSKAIPQEDFIKLLKDLP